MRVVFSECLVAVVHGILFLLLRVCCLIANSLQKVVIFSFSGCLYDFPFILITVSLQCVWYRCPFVHPSASLGGLVSHGLQNIPSYCSSVVVPTALPRVPWSSCQMCAGPSPPRLPCLSDSLLYFPCLYLSGAAF